MLQLKVFLLLIFLSGSFSNINEKNLIEDLFSVYHPFVRPVLDSSKPIAVSLGLDIQSIENVDEASQTITLNSWLKFDWRDQYLWWNESNYNHVYTISIPINEIWSPDIGLYNSATGDPFPWSKHVTKAIVYGSGAQKDGAMVSWIAPALLKGTCTIDLADFPFDRQNCTFKFGSWTMSGAEIDLTLGTVGLATYAPNDKWKLMNVPAQRNVVKYDCCPEPYYDVTFHVVLERRSYLFPKLLYVPALLLAILSFLGFLMPARLEKAIFEAIMLLSLLVLYGLVRYSTPSMSGITKIDKLLLSFLLFVTMALLFSVIVAIVDSQIGHMSSCTRTLFSKLIGPVMFAQIPAGRFRNPDYPSVPDSLIKDQNPIVEVMLKLRNDVQKVREEIVFLVELKENENEWHFAAVALDRLLFIVLCVFFLFSLIIGLV